MKVTYQVLDVPSASRYELREGGVVVGIAEYRIEGDVVVVPHTEISPERRGAGLGAVLVAGMLDEIRSTRRSIRPQCWYVAQFLGEHPEYADVVER